MNVETLSGAMEAYELFKRKADGVMKIALCPDGDLK